MKRYNKAEMEILVWSEEEIVRTSGEKLPDVPVGEDDLPIVPWPTV